MKKRILTINAKCSDAFSASLFEDTHDKLTTTRRCLGEYVGYVPAWLPNPNADHGGDYVELRIDVDTGQILNWKKPTAKDLQLLKP